jgi:hypothetical protein
LPNAPAVGLAAFVLSLFATSLAWILAQAVTHGVAGRTCLYLTIAVLDTAALVGGVVFAPGAPALPPLPSTSSTARRELLVPAAGVLLLIAAAWVTMPGKIGIEALDGDATEVHGFAASLFTRALPEWDLENGAWGFYPTFMFVAYPVFESLALLGDTEAAVRLPALLFLGILVLALADLAGRGRALRAGGSLRVLLPLLAAGYLSLQVGAYYAGYHPFHGDLGAVALDEWVAAALATCALLLLREARRPRRRGVPRDLWRSPAGSRLVAIAGVKSRRPRIDVERWCGGVPRGAPCRLRGAGRPHAGERPSTRCSTSGGRSTSRVASRSVRSGVAQAHRRLVGALAGRGAGLWAVRGVFARDAMRAGSRDCRALSSPLALAEQEHSLRAAGRALPGGRVEREVVGRRLARLRSSPRCSLSIACVIAISRPRANPPYVADREFGRRSIFLADSERQAVEFSHVLFNVMDPLWKWQPDGPWVVGHHTWAMYADRGFDLPREYDFYVGEGPPPAPGLTEITKIYAADGRPVTLWARGGRSALREWKHRVYPLRVEQSRFNFEMPLARHSGGAARRPRSSAGGPLDSLSLPHQQAICPLFTASPTSNR